MTNTANACPVSTEATYTAARILLDRLPLLASQNPDEMKRAHRLTLAVAEILAAEGELMEQDNADRNANLGKAFAQGIRDGFAMND